MDLPDSKLENKMEVDASDSSSNNSNSPEVLSEDEDVNEEKISEIQNQIKGNPYLYEPHIQLITLLRKSCDLDRLRIAREEMNKVFPLTPELWLDWLTDEKALAVTDKEKESMIALFERAIKDYTSVFIWLEYVQYVIGQMAAENGIENVRQTFERALTAIGIHVVQGSLVWDAFREFENALLKSMQVSEDQSDKQAEKIEEQQNRIYNLFRRQLSVPLLDMDKTYKELKEAYPNKKDSPLEQMYKKALTKLESLKPYEDALFQSESPHLEEYRRYIKHEVGKGDPVRVQSIFERALVENCLIPDLWVEYTNYLDRVIKIDTVALAAHERAVRNCPWSVHCWKNYALALERHKQPHAAVNDCFEKALNSGFTEGEEYRELWLGYLDYMRRRINLACEDYESELNELREVFERAAEHMNTFEENADDQCSILQYWAKVEVKYGKSASRGREIWETIMEQGHQREAEMWMNYANFERVFGDQKHYRKVLLKGLHNASDWPESLGNLLLMFEREEGSLESLDFAVAKYEAQMQQVQEKRQRLAKKEADRQEEQAVHKKQIRSEKRAAKSSGSLLQSKAEKHKSPNKRNVQMDSEGFKIPPPPSQSQESSRVPPLPDHSRKRTETEELPHESKRQKVDETEHGVTVKHDSSRDDRSVFLSNLSYTIEEDKIKAMFSEVGTIEEVRLVKDYRGRSKGFCYVVFSSMAEAQHALEKDRERLDGRPVFISRCEDKRHRSTAESKFKFRTGLEKNKLFLKNLPFTTTEDDLKTIFQEFGTLKEVRLVTYRNGHSKGLAYVEFQNESSAAAAVVKTDGSKIGEHVISVAISNPPERKSRKDSSRGVSISSSLGGGGSSSTAGPRGRGRTQVALLPRALQKPTTQQKPSTSASRNSIQNGSSNGAEDSSESKKLGNDDFRRMFLKN